jgi:GTP-binding protein
MTRLPVVAVVGRPNVGKSTLVNRVLGSRSAVVEETPGVTRDRREFQAEWTGRGFLLVDTGGWETRPEDDLSAAVRQQAEAALSAADLVVLVLDATAGVTEDDAGVVAMLRKGSIPVVVAANKVDSAAREAAAAELWGLGLGEPMAISAIHGRGVGELLDRVVEGLPESPPGEVSDGIPRIAVAGRPNVGKSTLINRLARTERVIVSAVPGTTRDPIDLEVRIDHRPFRLVDTAGLRRPPQIKESADYYSVARAREAITRSDVVLLMLDGSEGVSQQDQRIAAELVEAGTGIVVLLNKWDAVVDREAVQRAVADRLAFIDWAPRLQVSAKTGAGLRRLGETIERVLAARVKRVPTGELNRLIREWAAAHLPPVRAGRRPQLQYAVQAGTSPPTVVLFVSGGELSGDYLRFLEHRLRKVADFTGSPIRILTRSK